MTAVSTDDNVKAVDSSSTFVTFVTGLDFTP